MPGSALHLLVGYWKGTQPVKVMLAVPKVLLS